MTSTLHDLGDHRGAVARSRLAGYRRLVERIGHSRAFGVMLRAAGARLDRRLYRASRGRLAISGPALFPVLLLTSTGRHTGRLRTTPVIYHRDGERLIVSSENTGQARPAAWPSNLAACPYACVQIGAAIRAVRARPATPDEVERYWPALVGLWPAHETYYRRSRSRRMYLLEPLGDPSRSGQ
jgi:deazaflavin-dependent oxidoreductase (nitroreductase family)